jgi:trans-aconitate methyltransferase
MPHNLRWALAQKLELIWWKRYLRPQGPEAYLARKRAYWERVLEQTGVEPRPGQSALDAGCGPAGIFMALPQLHTDAVDPLLDQYAQSLPHFDTAAYPWVRFHSVAFEDWTPSQTYDLVFCLNALNHFRDLHASLSRLKTALAPNGLLLLAIDAHRFSFLKPIFQLLPGDALHPHQYTLADYRNMLESHGIQILRAQTLKQGRIFDYVALVGRRGTVGGGRGADDGVERVVGM